MRGICNFLVVSCVHRDAIRMACGPFSCSRWLTSGPHHFCPQLWVRSGLHITLCPPACKGVISLSGEQSFCRKRSRLAWGEWEKGCPPEKAARSEGLCCAFPSSLNIWMCSACLIRVEQNRSLLFMPIKEANLPVSCPMNSVWDTRVSLGSCRMGGRFLTAKKCRFPTAQMVCAGARAHL